MKIALLLLIWGLISPANNKISDEAKMNLAQYAVSIEGDIDTVARVVSGESQNCGFT